MMRLLPTTAALFNAATLPSVETLRDCVAPCPGCASLPAPSRSSLLSFASCSSVAHLLFFSFRSADCSGANISSGLFKELIKRKGATWFMALFSLPHLLLLLDPQLPVTAGHSAVFAFDTVARRADISHGGTIPHIAHMRCLDFASAPTADSHT